MQNKSVFFQNVLIFILWNPSAKIQENMNKQNDKEENTLLIDKENQSIEYTVFLLFLGHQCLY